MILYKKKSNSIFRYLLGSIVLVLGLTLTVADVYGLQMPFGHKAVDSYTDSQNKKIEITDYNPIDNIVIDNSYDIYNDNGQSSDTVPTSVPEPSTIILLASGLGLLRIANRKNK